mmetsp:Transcript_8743/g.14120  ORF Transcript_8743/g.14120 Transcript_8743/m.14120 type:complete len:93 (-) Transcript_8743:14-292(-)
MGTVRQHSRNHRSNNQNNPRKVLMFVHLHDHRWNSNDQHRAQHIPRRSKMPKIDGCRATSDFHNRTVFLLHRLKGAYEYIEYHKLTKTITCQ